MVQVQAILFASLATSLLSAFLAMLGKQWLNRYASTDMRGSAIERSQSRQRKLDGIGAWYFDSVMESLPLMLQAALLLLGCAHCRYLWETSITVASVVLSVSSFGLLFYYFILVVGTAWESCPYQTPGSQFFRYMGPAVPRIVRSVVRPMALALRNVNQQTATLDLRCVLWTLQTSLDKSVRLSTLEYLATTTVFTELDSTLVTTCFDILVGCISVNGGKVIVMQGFEHLAAASAKCFFHSLRHLSAAYPTSSVLANLHRRYRGIFLSDADFRGLPFYHPMTGIHALAYRGWGHRHIGWTDYRPSNHELIPFARHMVGAAQTEYQWTQNNKVPCWILRFALHFLSLDPPSPESVVADCLTIIAIALDHDPSGVLVLDERYVRFVYGYAPS